MESMSRAPFLLPNVRQGYKYGDQKTVDALVNDGLWCSFENAPMGNAAEHTARTCSINRGEQDRFSAQSHQRAAAAWERGDFADEVFAVVPEKKGAAPVTRDEGIRAETTIEALAKLKPAFLSDGTVTAGNASQLSDGAAAVVVASEAYVKSSGVKPLAKIVASAMSGVAPVDLFIAPVKAVQTVLQRARLTIEKIDLFELNEAFAAQLLACSSLLPLPEDRVNVLGGAIALGHPIGASGARVLVTLVHALRRRNLRYGVASLCLGGGNAVAMVIERV
jgi:acetyl-CoA C-acetyltransferase